MKLAPQQAAEHQGSFLIKVEAQKLWLGLCPRQASSASTLHLTSSSQQAA